METTTIQMLDAMIATLCETAGEGEVVKAVARHLRANASGYGEWRAVADELDGFAENDI